MQKCCTGSNIEISDIKFIYFYLTLRVNIMYRETRTPFNIQAVESENSKRFNEIHFKEQHKFYNIKITMIENKINLRLNL
jgi:hypothetical protein